MNSSVLGQHMLISLVSWLLGMIIGGSLGYLGAIAARSIFRNAPELRRPLTLLPWRTIVVALPLASPFIPQWAGLGTTAGILISGLILSVLAMLITTTLFVGHWPPQPFLIQLASGARTLAAASSLTAAAAGIVGGGGAGYQIIQGMNLLDPTQYFAGTWTVILVALALDLTIGIVQLFFMKPSTA